MADANRHALVVAISDYQDEQLRRLAAPVNDAKAFAKALADPSIGNFTIGPAVINKSASDVLETMEGWLRERLPSDLVVVYFSGHGLKDDGGNLYLAARNTATNRLLSTGIADSVLRALLSACRAKQQVLILDCCFGGAIARGLGKGTTDDRVDVVTAFDAQARGRVILTASNAMQYSFEDDTKAEDVRQSVYTRTIVDGIRSGEADVNRDGQISAEDLHNFASRRIANPRQTPTITSIGLEGTIVLARAAIPQPPTPTVAGTLGIEQPRGVDLRPYVKVHDQGSEASNPAMAGITALEIRLAYRGQSMALSTRYVYQKAKELAGRKPEEDIGVEMNVLRDALERFGAPPEEAWPYRSGQLQKPRRVSTAKLDELAAPFRARFLPVGTQRELVDRLGQGMPILASFSVYESTWMSGKASREGEVAAPKPGEVPLGSVAVVIVDLDVKAGVLRFAHTWGEQWGLRGLGSMTLQAARKMLNVQEMWAVDLAQSLTRGGFQWDETALRVTAANVTAPSATAPNATADRADATIDAGGPTSPKPRKRRLVAPTTGARRQVFDGRHVGDVFVASLPARALARAESDPPTGDSEVDRVFDAMGAFHGFFLDVFERDSWDGLGAPLRAVVHFGRDYANAFWDSSNRQVVLGDGDNRVFGTFASLDVVAKELSQGFVQSATHMQYERESGALHQSLAAIFGSMVKQYAAGETSAKADWLIGDSILAQNVKGKALISLLHPGAAYNDTILGKDPTIGHYKEFVRSGDDSSALRINSGIGTRAFALAARALRGHSWERAGRIWFDAVTSGKVTKTSTYERFAKLTVTAANQRFDAKVADTIRQAWADVGVTAG